MLQYKRCEVVIYYLQNKHFDFFNKFSVIMQI